MIVEPEKIKPVAYVLSFFVFGSASTLMLSNYLKAGFGTRDKPLELNYWDVKESGLLIGVSLFSFESISLIINVRRTTRNPKKMRQLVYITFISAAVFFIFFALSFHLV